MLPVVEGPLPVACSWTKVHIAALTAPFAAAVWCAPALVPRQYIRHSCDPKAVTALRWPCSARPPDSANTGWRLIATLLPPVGAAAARFPSNNGLKAQRVPLQVTDTPVPSRCPAHHSASYRSTSIRPCSLTIEQGELSSAPFATFGRRSSQVTMKGERGGGG